MRIFKPIKQLNDEVARKIQAGEVIERPESVVRELIDNAIDSGAKNIVLSIQEGGIKEILISDNGSGMEHSDLELVAQRHATSKIESADDLLSAKTLGFRGEALSSMAAVARLEITSTRTEGESYRLITGPGLGRHIERTSSTQGTVVKVTKLFESFPARKQFLKSVQSESLLCRQIIEEKALAYNDRSFKFINEEKIIFNLPESSVKARVLALKQKDEPESFFHSLKGEGDGFSFTIIAGDRNISRKDKRNICVFVNGRKLHEYKFIQGIEYAYQGYLPGGLYPFAYAFITVDPKFVDFNIHPAKKEARFKNADQIRTSLSRAVSAMLQEKPSSEYVEKKYVSQNFENLYPLPSGFNYEVQKDSNIEISKNQIAATIESIYQSDFVPKNIEKDNIAETTNQSLENNIQFTYLGQAQGCFLLVEKDTDVYFIDQHAAHERYLFDKLISKGFPVQELLVPYSFETTKDEDLVLNEIALELKDKGFILHRDKECFWELSHVPSIVQKNFTIYIEAFKECIGQEKEPLKKLMASIACKSAIKDGAILAHNDAVELCTIAFNLPIPYCPHGRPIYFIISKENAFKNVKRII